ncbi:MAG: pyrrolo-quinoline quinone [Myxococcales bacterium]|nr:pyrrolo-quinoline quinone [Myxococcales bacterium]
MFRADVERSGFAAGSVVGAHVDHVWEIPSFNVTPYDAVKGSPVVAGDVVFCGTDTGRVVAARASDGSIVWHIQIDHAAKGIHGSPAVVDDTVYIGAYDGTLYALERTTGHQRWRRTIGFAVGSSPAVVPAWATVFSSHELPDGSGYVVAFDVRTGDVRWQQPTAAHPHSSVAIDVARALVFVGDNLGNVYAFDARTGATHWRRALDRVEGKAEIKGTPTVIPELGLVVVGAWSGKLVALDEESGAVVWEHTTGGRLMGSTAYLPSTRTVFAGLPSGRLIALDGSTGELRWDHAVGAAIHSSPALSGDGRTVVFGASDGRVYALATSDGREIWSTWVGGLVTGSPALVKDRIYITAQHGSLWALETRDE